MPLTTSHPLDWSNERPNVAELIDAVCTTLPWRNSQEVAYDNDHPSVYQRYAFDLTRHVHQATIDLIPSHYKLYFILESSWRNVNQLDQIWLVPTKHLSKLHDRGLDHWYAHHHVIEVPILSEQMLLWAIDLTNPKRRGHAWSQVIYFTDVASDNDGVLDNQIDWQTILANPAYQQEISWMAHDLLVEWSKISRQDVSLDMVLSRSYDIMSAATPLMNHDLPADLLDWIKVIGLPVGLPQARLIAYQPH